MKNLVIFPFFLIYLIVQSQEPEELIKRGDSLNEVAKYDSAIFYYDLFIKQFGHNNESCEVLNKMADIYNKVGNGIMSKAISKRVFRICNSSDQIETRAIAYLNLSRSLSIYESNYDSALLPMSFS